MSEVWAFLRKTVARRGYPPGGQIRCSLLGRVPWEVIEGKTRAVIPSELQHRATLEGFKIVDADWRDDKYTLEILP